MVCAGGLINVSTCRADGGGNHIGAELRDPDHPCQEQRGRGGGVPHLHGTVQPSVQAGGQYLSFLSGSVLDPNTLNLDTGPEFWSNLAPDPSTLNEKLKLTEKKFSLKCTYLFKTIRK